MSVSWYSFRNLFRKSCIDFSMNFPFQNPEICWKIHPIFFIVSFRRNSSSFVTNSLGILVLFRNSYKNPPRIFSETFAGIPSVKPPVILSGIDPGIHQYFPAQFLRNSQQQGVKHIYQGIVTYFQNIVKKLYQKFLQKHLDPGLENYPELAIII